VLPKYRSRTKQIQNKTMFDRLFEPESLITLSIMIVVGVVAFLLHKRQSGQDGGDDSAVKHGGKRLLDQYSTNFTQMARDGKLPPVVGRQREVDHLVQVLSRKTKNNAMLLGKPGVGKTAVVERLARLIADNNVPESIAGKDVIALDLSSLVSGTKYRGELERRLDTLRKEFRAATSSVILFIDEIQQLAQAKGSEGGLNPGDILKPELSRGTLQVIGATTYDDYEKYIVPEESLERRFQPIHVHEPTREEAMQIVNGVQEVFGQFHKVTYTDEALEAIVDLSNHYIHKRYLPDKAIDVLDEAGVRARLAHIHGRSKGKMDILPVVSVETIKEVVSEWSEVPIDQIHFPCKEEKVQEDDDK